MTGTSGGASIGQPFSIAGSRGWAIPSALSRQSPGTSARPPVGWPAVSHSGPDNQGVRVGRLGRQRERAVAPRKTADILTFEQRGEDFALVRAEADGSRSEIVLTAANIVHLGLLAPGFARQVLTDKVGRQPGTVARLVRHTALSANLRFIEILLTILDRGGARLDFPTTERRARALATKLVERADRIASSP